MGRFLILAATFLGLLLLGAGAFGLSRWQEVRAEREARIQALQVGEVERAASPALGRDVACEIAELELLTRGIGRAFSVDCSDAVLTPTGEDAALLDGVLWAPDEASAILGGGHREGFCLARTAGGWELVGDAFHLQGCKYVVPGASAAEVADAAGAAVAAEKEARARALLERVQSRPGGKTSSVCKGLELSPDRLLLLDTRLLLPVESAPEAPAKKGKKGKKGKEGKEGKAAPQATPQRPRVEPAWLSAGGLAACQAQALVPCGIGPEPTHVLLFDGVQYEGVKARGESFSGGTFSATAVMLDAASGAVLCARPIDYQLPDEVLLLEGHPLIQEFDSGMKKAICEAVDKMGEGKIHLDPWFGC